MNSHTFALTHTHRLAFGALVSILAACGDDAASTSTSTSDSSSTSSSSSSETSSTGTGGDGGAGGAMGSSQQNAVAVGGCWDSPGCGTPNPEGSNASCVSCQMKSPSCDTLYEACMADTDCAAILACVSETCSAASCVASCTTGHEAGGAAYREMLLCGYCACNTVLDTCQADLDALSPPGTCPTQ